MENTNKSELTDSGDDTCLGFKDGKCILQKITKTEAKTPIKQINTNMKTLLVKVDPQSGDKYIDVNGKRIKIVPPKSNTLALNLKKVLSEQANKKIPVVTKTCDKQNLKLVVNGLTKKKIPIIARACDKPNIKINKSEIMKINKSREQFVKVPVVFRSTAVVGMEPNLKFCDTSVQTEPCNLATDAVKNNMCNTTCQTEKVMVDSSCQTDVDSNGKLKPLDSNGSFDSLVIDRIDFFDNDCSNDSIFSNVHNKPIINEDVNMGNGPTIVPLCKESVREIKMKQFYYDLKTALIPNADGNFPIHEAVISDDLHAVQRICAVLRARQESIDLENHDHITPLQLTVIFDSQLPIIEYLLKKGANILHCDDEGNNLLHLAVIYDRPHILNEFLKAENIDCIDTFNFEGQTPLIMASMKGLHACAKLLINFHCDINVRDKKSGRTALFHAAEKHDVSMVQLLLDNHADPKIKNFFGTSPHDAMYEIDEVPQLIKSLIFKKSKRKISELMMQVRNRERDGPSKKMLKTYPKLRKIDPGSMDLSKKAVSPVK